MRESIGQSVKLSSFKTILVAFLTLFLGAGQGVCASLMPIPCEAGFADNWHHGDMSAGHHAAAHDRHGDSRGQPSKQNPPHNNDCSYCASTHEYKALAKSEFGATVDLPAVEKARSTDPLIVNAHAEHAQKNLQARFWPDQHKQTPVLLKIRLLI